MRSKQKTVIFIIGVIILVVALLSWSRLMGTGEAVAQTWRDTSVACLANGHQNVQSHIHANLSITVDGDQQLVPPNVGISNTCMAEAHTHDGSGTIHVETTDVSAERTVGEFFAVWGQNIEKPGHELVAEIDGEVVEDVATHTISDGETITLTYTSTQAQ